LLARHCTEAGQIEKAAELWGKAGQRSVERSALVEAVEQLTRALDQIAAVPTKPALRREQIKLQAALITPLIHVKGFAAAETKAAGAMPLQSGSPGLLMMLGNKSEFLSRFDGGVVRTNRVGLFVRLS
jgi:hypothetical protein